MISRPTFPPPVSLVAAALLALSLALAGCKRNDSPANPAAQPQPGASSNSTSAAAPARAGSGLALVTMPIGTETFTLEVADTEEARRRGLMYRQFMDANHGMIFVFQEEEELSFWMEATLIPLDILYLDAAGRVVSVKGMRPRDRTGVPSDGPAMYAIELNRGTAARVGVKPGDTLALPDAVRVR